MRESGGGGVVVRLLAMVVRSRRRGRSSRSISSSINGNSCAAIYSTCTSTALPPSQAAWSQSGSSKDDSN